VPYCCWLPQAPFPLLVLQNSTRMASSPRNTSTWVRVLNTCPESVH
jgi:hypothetical protein